MAVGRVAVGQQVRRGRALPRRLQGAAELVEHAGDRLVRDCRLALFQRRNVDRRVLMIRGDVDDALDVFLLEHLAVVLVAAQPFARPALLAVIGGGDLARDLAAGANTLVAGAPLRLLEETADGGAITPVAPVDVVLRIAIGVDHRGQVDVRPLDQRGVDLPLRLRAAAHLRQDDHVAGCDIAGAAEHAARHDRETCRGSQTAEERATTNFRHGRAP
jgi:hypothetical protein